MTEQDFDRIQQELGIIPTPKTVQIIADIIKYVKDQQPKPKTLEQIGWMDYGPKFDLNIFKDETVGTPLGYYEVREQDGNWFWSFDRSGYSEVVQTYPCDSKEHGKQCAQVHYDGKINSLFGDKKVNEDARRTILLKALETIIELNLQTAKDQYGDRSKAEEWACVKIAREAIKKAT